MQSAIEPTRPPTVGFWHYILGRNPKWNGMSGVEMLIRYAVLFLFAAFFIMPLVWLAIAPTRVWRDMYDLTQSPLSIGPLSNYLVAWNDIAMFGQSLMVTWTVNSIWYTLSCVFLSIAVSIPTGYVLAVMKFRGRTL